MMFGSYFTSSCLKDGSCLIYVMCACLRIVVSNTYCVVALFDFSSSCVPYVSLDCPFLMPLFSSLTFIYDGCRM